MQPRIADRREQHRDRRCPGCGVSACRRRRRQARSWRAHGTEGSPIRQMRQDRSVTLQQAMEATRFVVENAPAPVSVYATDDHGEVVAAATMDGAAPDTRLNAQRKAYTAARSDATSTAALAEKALADAAERASFDPFFTFFKGGVAAFEGDRRVGALGVSGLPGEDDDALARRAIAAAGLSARRLGRSQLERLDHAVGDPPAGELVASHRVDEVRASGPQADVLDVGARGARRRGEMRVEDRELVPSSSRNHVSGGTSSSNRYGDAAALTPATYRSATPPLTTTRPHASFGDSSRACSASASRTGAGITTRRNVPSSSRRRTRPRSRRTGTSTPRLRARTRPRPRRAPLQAGAPRRRRRPRRLHRHAFALEQQPEAGHRVGVGDEQLPVELRHVEDRRHVAVVERAQSHHLVTGKRLRCRDDHVGERLAEALAGAHERPARAEAGDEDVDPVEGGGDLRSRPLVVRTRVGLVRVLERHEERRVTLGELDGEPDRSVRSLLARRLDDLGAVEAEQLRRSAVTFAGTTQVSG